MRGSTRVGVLTVCLVSVFALMATSAWAGPQLSTDNTRTTLLRDVNATPAHQPDALEFVNNGNVELAVEIAGLHKTIVCTEIEIGSTVLSNTNTLAKLALPLGIAEGDNCKVGTSNVPTYFDTLATGAVGNAANGNVASITVTEPKAGELIATINDLKLSHNVPGIGFCTSDLNGIKGTITNVATGFVEEQTPNLNVQFTKAKVPITGVTGCPTEGEFTGNFVLETPSTTADTAFVGPPAPPPPPPARIERVNFTNNENVAIDHTKEASPSKLTKEEEEPQKPLEIDKYEGEPGEERDAVEWKSPKAGKVAKNWPVAFPQATTMKLANMRLALEPETQAFLKTKLEGEVTVIGETTVGATPIKVEQKITQKEVEAQIEGVGSHPTYLEMPATVAASAALPKEVSYSKMTIKWRWTLKEKGAPGLLEQGVGESTHNLYVTNAKALTLPIAFALLAQDTEDVHKESATPTPAQVVSGVWKGFSNGAGAPAGMHVWIYNPATGAISQGLEAMWYYQEMPLENYKEVREAEEDAFAIQKGLTTTVELLEYLDAQCAAWREAFDKALEAEGMRGANVEVVPKVEAAGKCKAAKECEMLVKNWKLPKVGGNFPNKEQEVEKEVGLAGQGVTTPSASFANHFVLEVDKKLYDPSYGIGPVAGTKGLGEGPLGGGAEAQEIQQKYQEKSIRGFCKFVGAELKCQEAKNALEVEVKPA